MIHNLINAIGLAPQNRNLAFQLVKGEVCTVSFFGQLSMTRILKIALIG